MAQRGPKRVLFLAADDPADAVAAAARFNAVAGKMGLPWRAESGPLTADVPAGADRVVIIRRSPMGSVAETPATGPEVLPVGDGADAAARLERAVMALVARLLGGGGDGPEDPVGEPPPAPAAQKSLTAKVGRETAGRRGKGVVTVFDTGLDDDGLRQLAGVLKQRCGTGGTVKDGRIEIQGDQRDRVVAELERLGYRVKRVGG